ncbi:MAG: tol-pal system-associated acyl-CoA thioesterase [Beijerinckiaceae bacterium]|jgi:acyl-CoA thioester hydrolase|nr:tol-pal system-associated acyl-CoA thioesterase [Beijerinckiaceae bacterium]
MSNVSHRLPIRIYYEDTDFSGVVYHASYLRFLERGRTEVLRDLGVHQAALHGDEGALAFVVRRMTIDWLKPARMDDLVTVETWVDTLRGASLLLGQRIMLGDTVLLTAEVLVALVQNGKAARLTQALREKLGSNQA